MHIDAENSELRQIPVSKIERNPENPRILFRQDELESLLESIRAYGVQVPISVYKHQGKFFLIDGERRWRCSLKLNKRTIPALVQEKPDRITNLLLMFNIHSLREQWDLLTIALKLPDVIKLLEKRLHHKPNEAELAERTGLSRSVIRRSKLLMELPIKYKEMMLKELDKPRAKQKLTEDLFIEMERALRTVERWMPTVVKDKDKVRDILINKYKHNTISNIVHFRKVAKIARAEDVHADKAEARYALNRLFKKNTYSIEDAYNDSVADAYEERDVASRIDSFLRRLDQLKHIEIDDELRDKLHQLVSRIMELLEQ